MCSGSAYKSPLKLRLIALAKYERFSRQLLHRLADRFGCRIARHRSAISDRNRIGDARGNLPKKASLLVTENTTPDAIETNGHYGCLHILHDALKTFAKRKQLAGASNLSFSENADDLTGL